MDVADSAYIFCTRLKKIFFLKSQTRQPELVYFTSFTDNLLAKLYIMI